MVQDATMPQQRVGANRDPKKAFQTALDKRDALVESQPHPKSDLQNMMDDEQRHHMDQYKYAHGHNDGSAVPGIPKA